jgi:hypothetical protein
VSTLTFSPQALGPLTGGSATAASGGTGGTGGTGAQSDPASITYPSVGFGPSAVTFTLVGAGGGKGGDDGPGTGGAGGVGARLVGQLEVRNGDVLRLHVGGAGGAGASGSAAAAAGTGGTSTCGAGGGDGGRPGGDGSSGGGAGGGAATVLRRSRVGTDLDVLAAGGGGGGGSGNAARDDLDARASDEAGVSPTLDGTDGTGVASDVDGGGGGGGGGGLPGGIGGDTFSVSVGVDRFELFGRGGRRGTSTAANDEVTIATAELAAALGAGAGTVRWHAVAVSHSVAPTAVAPDAPVVAAGAAAASDGLTSTLTLAFPAAVAAGTHTYAVWNDTADLTGDPAPLPDTTGTVDAEQTTLAITGLALTESHVVRVTHTGSAGSASSTLTLAPQSLTATASAGSTTDSTTGASGGAGGTADATLTAVDAGFAPTAVHFTLTGAGGGAGGRDGSWQGGSAGLGQRISGTLGVRPGDTLGLHAGGGGGDGAPNSNIAGGGGGGGASTIAGAYGGGAGGRPGPEGTSGGGGGGGSATALRRVRGPVRHDVVAAGGGGGGGSGNGSPGAAPGLAARDFDAGDAVADLGTVGEAGAAKSSADGGGGGGGGGGVIGGGGGDLYKPDANINEEFGRGGRRGSSTSTGGDVTVASSTTAGQARDGGAGSVRRATAARSAG